MEIIVQLAKILQINVIQRVRGVNLEREICEIRVLTPSTTNSSPQTYWLAPLAKNTTGPAKSFGSPQRPAGIRSLIWRRRVGSLSSFSFLSSFQSVNVALFIGTCGSVERRDVHISGDIARDDPIHLDVIFTPFVAQRLSELAQGALRGCIGWYGKTSLSEEYKD